MDQMKTYQNYMNTKQGQDITLGEQAITMGGIGINSAQVDLEAKKFGLTADRFTAFVKAVNSGADLATANAQAGTNVTPAAFDTISRDYKYSGTVQGLTVADLKTKLTDA
jgi:hypothetical protein